MNKLVYIDEHGLQGTSFYWQNRERYNLSKAELSTAGVSDRRVRIHRELIEPLLSASREFQKHGYNLFIKDGYRPRALYKLVYAKRRQQFSHQNVNSLLNMDEMPHASGRTVDIGLIDRHSGEEMSAHNSRDGHESLFIDFYRSKIGNVSQQFQQRQDLIKTVMHKHGFEFGPKGEYFHFNYTGKKTV